MRISHHRYPFVNDTMFQTSLTFQRLSYKHFYDDMPCFGYLYSDYEYPYQGLDNHTRAWHHLVIYPLLRTIIIT